MKKLILTAVAALLLTGAQAQDNRPPRDRDGFTPEKIAQNETDRMVKELKLDKKQKERLGEINLKFAKEQFALRDQRKGSREDMRKNMENIQMEKERAYEKVLSPKEFTKYKKQREEMRKRMDERRQNGDQENDPGRGRNGGPENPSQD